MAMNPEVKAKWVAALRSGEYTQGQGKQYNSEDNTYCCLGVLGRLAANEGVVEWVDSYQDEGRGGAVNTEGYCPSVAPPGVTEWAGVNVNDNLIPAPVLDYAGPISLWLLNDSDEASFDFIADLIEEHL